MNPLRSWLGEDEGMGEAWPDTSSLTASCSLSDSLPYATVRIEAQAFSSSRCGGAAIIGVGEAFAVRAGWTLGPGLEGLGDGLGEGLGEGIGDWPPGWWQWQRVVELGREVLLW